MKRGTLLTILTIILFSAIAGCSGDDAGIVAPAADDQAGDSLDKAQVPASAHRINCQGSKCTLPGEPVIPGYPTRTYSYIVTPGQSGVGLVRIGTRLLGQLNPSNLIMPQGWTVVVKMSPPAPDRNQLVRHGNIANPSGRTTRILEFRGPVMTTPFQLAFDYDLPANTVSWRLNTGTDVDWNSAVGDGLGPIHAPTNIVNGGGGTYIGPGDVVPPR